MTNWLSFFKERHCACVLVTVAYVEGSTPREAGAKMVVTLDAQFDTIGGGHLEMRACDIARTMLSMSETSLNSERRLERFALGPSLGQCCGGVVHLVFERIDLAAQSYVNSLNTYTQKQQDCWRVVALDSTQQTVIIDREHKSTNDLLRQSAPLHEAPITFDGAELSIGRRVGVRDNLISVVVDSTTLSPIPSPTSGRGELHAIDLHRQCHIMQDQNGTRWLIDPCFANHRHVMLFGAGHVGASLVRALGELPCNITWIDEREDMFPASMPNNVTTEATDTPETFVDHAPAGTFFLVMTHSHALDQRLAECILRRADIGWFGLIGSLTKRRQFEHRLRERGIDDARLAHMTCPIGIDGINGKEPAVIAASVCAQLLCLWDKGLETISRKNSQCNPMP